jgi:hypothetical protein
MLERHRRNYSPIDLNQGWRIKVCQNKKNEGDTHER